MPALAIVPSRMTRSMALNVETNVEALVSAVRAQATQAQLLHVYRVATLLELARCVAVMAADWTGTAARLLDKVSCKTAQEAELRVVEQLKHTLHNHRNHTGRLGRFLAEFWKQGKPDTMPTAVHAALWAWFEAPAHDDVLHGVSKTQALLQALRAELPQEAELCKQGVRLYSYNVLHMVYSDPVFQIFDLHAKNGRRLFRSRYPFEGRLQRFLSFDCAFLILVKAHDIVHVCS